MERFNRTFCQEVLGAYVFESRDQVRKNSAEWMREYVNERSHDTLDGMTLASFRECLLDGQVYDSPPPFEVLPLYLSLSHVLGYYF